MSRDSLKILLVEDNPGDARLIREMLAEADDTVCQVEGVEELSAAEEILRRTQFDLVLLDLSLPDSHGLDTFARTQPLVPETPIIVLSGLEDQTVAVRSVQAGAQDYLVKAQVNSNLLVRAIRYAIERKRAEIERARLLAAEQEARAEAVAAERRFRDLVNSIDGIVWEADARTFQFLFVSKQAERLLGYPVERWLRELTFWREHVHPEDGERALDLCLSATARCQDHEFEYRMIAADGQIVWLRDIVTIVAEGGQAVKLRGVMVDISEAKRAEQERTRLLAREQTARKEAEEANRLKDEFLATVSHELRTPLNAIIGWAHMLRQGGLDEPTAARALETVQRNALAQAKLIEDILDVSRVITGKLGLNIGPVDMAAVINEAVDSVQLAAASKGIRLEATLDPSARHTSGDAGRLQQVVWNLLSNAIKFTPSGGRVRVRLRRVGPDVEICVSDTGCGLSTDFLPFIFDRFRQADGTSTRQHGGLGLGLAIVRHLVELHGGTVRAESPGEGQGATFTVRLPVMVSRPQPKKSEPALRGGDGRAPEFPPVLGGLRILVVDDEADAREMFTVALTQCKAEVKTAKSVAEALEVFERWRPDVLVCDIEMPGEHGYSLIQKVRALESRLDCQTPAVAVTAYAGAEDRMRALAAGYNMHVPKPVNLSELVTLIASLPGVKK